MLKIFQVTFTNELNEQHTIELLGYDVIDVKTAFALNMGKSIIDEVKFIRNFI